MLTLNSQANNYQTLKMSRRVPKFQKVKPILGGDYQISHLMQSHLYIFKNNPLFEEYF